MPIHTMIATHRSGHQKTWTEPDQTVVIQQLAIYLGEHPDVVTASIRSESAMVLSYEAARDEHCSLHDAPAEPCPVHEELREFHAGCPTCAREREEEDGDTDERRTS